MRTLDRCRTLGDELVVMSSVARSIPASLSCVTAVASTKLAMVSENDTTRTRRFVEAARPLTGEEKALVLEVDNLESELWSVVFVDAAIAD